MLEVMSEIAFALVKLLYIPIKRIPNKALRIILTILFIPISILLTVALIIGIIIGGIYLFVFFARLGRG
ncbi:MAG: hypothetical protein FWG83_07090 [Oscillospiraceae bacterium]|nr:hypothetical protein [Oscillospiraceae bacterium]